MSRIDLIKKIHSEYVERINEVANPSIVLEIENFISNDVKLYNGMTKSILNNLKRKKTKGNFDEKLAIKAFTHLAKAGIKKYEKDFDSLNIPKGSIKKTEEAIAKRLYDRHKEDLNEFYDKYVDIYNQLDSYNKVIITEKLNNTKEGLRVVSFIEGL